MGRDRQVNRAITKPCDVCHERRWRGLYWELLWSQRKEWVRQLEWWERRLEDDEGSCLPWYGHAELWRVIQRRGGLLWASRGHREQNKKIDELKNAFIQYLGILMNTHKANSYWTLICCLPGTVLYSCVLYLTSSLLSAQRSVLSAQCSVQRWASCLMNQKLLPCPRWSIWFVLCLQ